MGRDLACDKRLEPAREDGGRLGPRQGDQQMQVLGHDNPRGQAGPAFAACFGEDADTRGGVAIILEDRDEIQDGGGEEDERARSLIVVVVALLREHAITLPLRSTRRLFVSTPRGGDMQNSVAPSYS